MGVTSWFPDTLEGVRIDLVFDEADASAPPVVDKAWASRFDQILADNQAKNLAVSAALESLAEEDRAGIEATDLWVMARGSVKFVVPSGLDPAKFDVAMVAFDEMMVGSVP